VWLISLAGNFQYSKKNPLNAVTSTHFYLWQRFSNDFLEAGQCMKVRQSHACVCFGQCYAFVNEVRWSFELLSLHKLTAF
jgi:hypothetical protein